MVQQIFAIRHGETEWSLSGRHTGKTDLSLTPRGEERALLLRERLQAIKFSHVFTSPLQRARRTAELAGFGAVMRVDPNLREWDYGENEGRTTPEIQAVQPGWNVFQDGSPQGESAEDITRRADAVLAGLRDLTGVVAVFSHGHFLRAFAAHWIGLPVREGRHFILDTGSLSILGYERPGSGVPAISLWNAGPTVS